MTQIANNAPCGDQARLFAFENATSAFQKAGVAYEIGTCTLCGKTGIPVYQKSKDATGCRAQMTLTQKRDTVEDGHPFDHTSPTVPGRFALSDKQASMLIGIGQGIVVAKVAPTSPLPTGVEVRRDVRFTDLLEMATADFPMPFFLVEFAQKCDGEMRVTESRSEIHVNGGSVPVTVDGAKLTRLVALIDEIGGANVRDISVFKATLSRNRDKAAKLKDAIEKRNPDLLRRFDEVPNGSPPELGYAHAIVLNRSRRSTDEDQTTTPGNEIQDPKA